MSRLCCLIENFSGKESVESILSEIEDGGLYGNLRGKFLKI